MNTSPSLPRTIWLLAAVRMRMLKNRIAFTGLKKAKVGEKRTATPRKRRAGLFATIFIMSIILINSFNMSRQAVVHVWHASNYIVDSIDDDDFILFLQSGTALIVTLLAIILMLMPLSALRQMGQSDWELEWLSCLPISRTRLLWSRLMERGLLHFGGLFLLWPFCTMSAHSAGWHWYAPLVGLAVALPLFILAAALTLALEVGLKMLLSAPVLRNMHALISLVSIALFYLALSFCMPAGEKLARTALQQWPQWANWTPGGLAAILLYSPHRINPAVVAAYLAEIAIAVWLCMSLLAVAVRRGFDRGDYRETGRLRQSPTRSIFARVDLPFSALQRRELLLLARDRNFMVQTLIVPIVVIFGQLFMNGGISNLHGLLSDTGTLTTMAFTIGVYVLSRSAFNALNHEGNALWLLYTLPRSLEALLREKVRMWAVIALLYPIVVLLIGLNHIAVIDYNLIISALTALVGIPMFASIAVTLGALGSAPTSLHQQAREQTAWIYLYMLLAALYGYAVHSADPIPKLVMLVLTMGLAIALWQKLRDQLPYLLDPIVAAPSRISAADGLVSAMLFFILQAVLYHFISDSDSAASGIDILESYSVAGLMTFLLVRYSFWRSKTAGMPTMSIFPLGKTLGYGLAGGGLAAVLGLAWLAFLVHFQFLPSSLSLDDSGPPIHRFILLGLAVFAAPLCEEFIFRGLIFGGLRRVLSVPRAMLLSAALFAIVHPVLSMLPVFALGLCTAFVYQRTKTLAAPMLVHAVYNAVVVGYQLSW